MVRFSSIVFSGGSKFSRWGTWAKIMGIEYHGSQYEADVRAVTPGKFFEKRSFDLVHFSYIQWLYS